MKKLSDATCIQLQNYCVLFTLYLEKLVNFSGYDMMAMQTLHDGFEGIPSTLSGNSLNSNRTTQINGLSNGNNGGVINIQSPTEFVQNKSPTLRVINNASSSVGRSPSEVQNSQSGKYYPTV